MSACDRSDFDAVKLAVEHGANVNALNEHGESALLCAVEYAPHKEMDDREYSAEEHLEHDRRENAKVKKIVQYLVAHGADLDLYGYDGCTALNCACFSSNVELVRFLLELGADPNTNSYLVGGLDSGVCSSGLLYAQEDAYSEYKAANDEIISLMEEAGARPMVWGWNPEEYEITGRPYICMIPMRNGLFEDECCKTCGDAHSLRICREGREPEVFPLDGVEGLNEWYGEFIENYDERAPRQSPEWWLDWRERGFALAEKVRSLLPDDVDMYYLPETPRVFCEAGFWDRSERFRLVESVRLEKRLNQ